MRTYVFTCYAPTKPFHEKSTSLCGMCKNRGCPQYLTTICFAEIYKRTEIVEVYIGISLLNFLTIRNIKKKW
jgi:hypothetical protein